MSHDNDTVVEETPEKENMQYDSAPSDSEESQSVSALESKVIELQKQLEEQKDQFLRKAAEMENFRKRLLRDKEDAVQFANRALLEDLVQIIDDFERAIKSSESNKEFDKLHDGVVMIENRFASMLERKYGLKRFDSKGQVFDPSYHEAVMMEDDPEGDTSLVIEDFQRGYILYEKVLRTAKVKVSKPGKEKLDKSNTEEENS